MAFFRDLPIKRKLAIAVLGTTCAALLAACAAFIWFELYTFRRSLEAKMTVLADVIGINSTAALLFKTPQDATDSLAALKAEPEILAACIYTPDGGFFAGYPSGRGAGAFPVQPEKGTRRDGERLLLFRPIVGEDRKQVGTIHLQATLSGMGERLRSYAGISAGVLLGSLLLAVTLSAGLQRAIARPILSLTRVAESISRNKDYSTRAEKVSNDEIGVLTDSFNRMLGDIAEQNAALETANVSLKGQSGALEAANASLHSQAHQILDTVSVLGSSAKEILAVTTQVSSSASETATAVAETTTTVEEVRQIAHVASDKARQVSQSAEQVMKSSEAGKRSTDETLEGMNNIRRQMESIAGSMLRLSEQSQAIAQIVAVVDDLAAQSNLLAVNASIEAAKAGDYGKGFAIVALEVKSLAAQSKQATNQVRAILQEIQKATADAVMTTEQGSKAVDAGVSQSIDAGKAIMTLAQSVALAAQAASQIAASSQQQLVGMDQVAAAMESVKQVSTHNLDSSRNLEAAARKLGDLGERLRQLVLDRPAGTRG